VRPPHVPLPAIALLTPPPQAPMAAWHGAVTSAHIEVPVVSRRVPKQASAGRGDDPATIAGSDELLAPRKAL
jgi:hypothetical protein